MKGFVAPASLKKGTSGKIGAFFMHSFMRAYMVLRLVLQKSSANYLVPRVFAQKGFDDLIFGHTFCVQFLKIF
jgi:hypothetical protein